MKPLLYEKIMKAGTPRTDQEVALMTALNNAQIFRIDNVAEYYYESPQIVWDERTDFPNLAPPFENMYFEYPYPENLVCEEGSFIHPGFGTRAGILCMTRETHGEKFKWYCTMATFGESITDGHISHLDIYLHYGVSEQGEFIPLDNQGGVLIYSANKQYPIEILQATKSIIFPAFLAISFMHCKNVKVLHRGPGEKPKEKRNRYEPRVKFHTLEITPMKRVLETEGRSGEVGLKRSLHICRGHFKDFQEKGLFGKYHGIYWWDSQVRGKAEAGIVHKDYSVNAPKG